MTKKYYVYKGYKKWLRNPSSGDSSEEEEPGQRV